MDKQLIYLYVDFSLMVALIALAYWIKNEIERVEEEYHYNFIISRLGDTGSQVFYFSTILLASICISLGFLLAYKTLRTGELIGSLVIAAFCVAGVLATFGLETGPGRLEYQFPLLLKISLYTVILITIGGVSLLFDESIGACDCILAVIPILAVLEKYLKKSASSKVPQQ